MKTWVVGWFSGVVVTCTLAGVGRGAIVVLNTGLTGEGRIISRNEREIVFHAEGAAHEVHLPAANVTKCVETDEHGADVSLVARPIPKWDIPPEPTAPPVVPPGPRPTYYLIPLHGEVGATILSSALEKSLADAVKRKPTAVVLDIDSPGGLVDEAKKIAKVLHKYNKQLRIIALTDQDLSAAAIVTLSVKEIYVKSSSTIGAATSYRVGGIELPPKVEEKMQSAWRAVARNSAEEGGHEPLLAEAMIDNDIELHLETVNGKAVVREGPGEKSLCRKGKILTLTSHEAVSCGLASGEADDLDELGKKLKFDGWTECKGLGTLMAEYLPKRNRQFEAANSRLTAEFQQICVRAKQTAPSAEVSQTLIRTPQRYVRLGNTIRPVGPPPTVVTNVSHAHWNEKSLQCVLALQEAERNLADQQELCKAFGQEGLAELVGEVAVDIAATRARIFDDRNQYGVPGSNVAGNRGATPQPGPAMPQAVTATTQPAPETPRPNPQAGGNFPVRTEKSELVGEIKGLGFSTVSPTGQPVIGFRYVLTSLDKKQSVRVLEPIFTKDELRRANSPPFKTVMAMDGYVVSGLTVEKKYDHIAIRVLFADYIDGQVQHNTYESEWLGDVQGYERHRLGDGTRPVIGIFGAGGSVMNGIGVVFRAAEGKLPAGAR